MDKKRSLHQSEVQKQHTLAVVSIIILIVGVAVLLYLSPQQFVGKVYEAPPQCTDRPAGVVAWWPGEGNSNDVTGRHNDAAIMMSTDPTYVSGKVGQAFSFNGVDQYLSVADHSDFDFGTRDFTIEGWIQTESENVQYIINKQTVSPNTGFALLINNALYPSCGGIHNVCLYITDNSDSSIQVGIGSMVNVGEITHIVVTREGTTLTFFSNGEIKGTVDIPDTISNNDRNLIIGARDSRLVHFNGLIDELTIYNQALTPEQIHNIYTADSLGKCQEESYRSPGMCSDGIDNDGNGLIDCADSGCSDTGTYTFSPRSANAMYEIPLSCPNSRVNALATVIRPDGIVGDVSFNNLNLCDLGTEDLGNRVTLCIGERGIGGTRRLDSTSILQGTNQDPHTEFGITFLFDEIVSPEEQKKVTLHLNKDLSSGEPLILGLSNFTTNLLKGQRPVFIVDGEYYLMSYEGEGFFSERNLKLTHIPEGFEYTAAQHPGTNVYVFRILGDRLLQVKIDDDWGRFEIQALQPGEAPVSFAVPNNLSRKFEVTFDRANPVRITDPDELDTLTVCEDDRAALIQTQAFVCKNNEPYLTLVRNIPQSQNLEGNNLAFLYTYDAPTNTKKVSVFIRKDLESAATLANNLDQLDFASAMVAGRRIAFQFQEKLYLLSHPTAPPLRLPSLQLTYYDGAGNANPEPHPDGSDLSVNFGIEDGSRVFLQTNTGDPPPPIQVYAKILAELSPIDLDSDFRASVFSDNPINFATPSFGLVEAAEQSRFRRDADVFNININGVETLLNFQTPYVQDNALFYYRSVTSPAEGLKKSASIYKLYNFSDDSVDSHVYDNNFINTFTSGKEIALAFGDSFYLLGYQGRGGGPLEPFSISRMKLSSLNQEEDFPLTVERAGEQISFRVPEGDVVVDIDRAEGILNLQGREIPFPAIDFNDFMTEITTTQNVNVGSSTLRLCFLNAYADFTAAKVCYDSNQILVDSTASVTIPIRGQEYLLEVNQQTGSNKKVRIRKVLALAPRTDYTNLDWLSFARNITSNTKPVFNITDVSGTSRLYLPSASNSRLQTFGLGEYPNGPVQALRNERQITPITSNGSIVLGDTLVTIKQEETGNELTPISVSFSVERYHYLPDSGMLIINSSLDSPLEFSVTPGGPVYTITISTIAGINNFVRITINDILNRNFALNDIRDLHLGGAVVRLQVTQLRDGDAVVTLQRIS